MNTTELRSAAVAVFLATEEDIAQDLSDKFIWAANKIDKLEKDIKEKENEN